MNSFLQLQRSDLTEDYRFEIKIPLDVGQHALLRQDLYNNGLYPRRVFESRIVNSVYLDTFERKDYSDNISGIGDRTKSRFRWYNENLSEIVLERKIKKNKASRKEIYRLDNPRNLHPALKQDLGELLGFNRNAIPLVLGNNLMPTLEVNYHREYYELSKDLRMTVDRNQKFRGLRPYSQLRFSNSPVYCVVEFKFPANQRARMQKMLQDLQNRVFRHSKYVIGTEVTSTWS